LLHGTISDGLQWAAAKAHRGFIKVGASAWYVPLEHMRETMKKILFATTALVATAGVAAADVKVSGYAEMGITGGDTATMQGSTVLDDVSQFHSDIDITFSLSGEADNGLTFGATIDLDEATDINASGLPSAAGGQSNGGVGGPLGENDMSVFIAFGGAKLTMGDTDGAFDAALQEVNIVDTINDDHSTHAGFNGNGGFDGSYDGQIARLDYAFDAFSVHVSTEIDDLDIGDPVWGLGFKYTAALAGLDLGIGLGYQTVDFGGGNNSVVGLSVDTTFDNGMRAIINYSKFDFVVGETTHWAIGLGYTINALTIAANYGEFDFGGGVTSDGYGLGVNYDLGGGLNAQFGYGSSDFGAGATFDTYSLGLAMSF
jgi:outer membrane protein OmpU